MDYDEFRAKLEQIEEQANLTIAEFPRATSAEFPKTLAKERQKMIIALVRYLRSELAGSRRRSVAGLRDDDADVPDAKVRH